MSFYRCSVLTILLSLSVTMMSAAPVNGQQAVPDKVSIPRLMKNLESDNIKVSSSAARTLGVVLSPGGRRGDDYEAVSKLLIGRLDSPKGALLRRECARALGRMRAKASIEKMKIAMNDEDIDVAMAAGEAVGKILPVDEARAYLIEQGTDAKEHMLVASLHGLAPISKAEDTAFLLKGLESENWRAQKDAVVGLERSVRAGAELTQENYDAIAGVLGNNILNASNQAIHFFTHIRNEDSFAAVLKAAETHGDGGKSDTTWRLRSQALRTLWHLGPAAQKNSLPVIIRQLGDRTVNVINEARRILNELRKEHFVSQADLFPVLLTELEKAEPLKLRGGIMREMGNHVDRQYASRVAKIAAKTLDDCLEDKTEWPPRMYSLNLVAASGHSGSMEQVANCVSDDVSNVRQSAGRALEELSALAPADEKAKVAPILQPLLTNPVDWRKTAIAAHAAGGYAVAETVKPLSLLLSHSVLNVRQSASHSLVTIVRNDEELKPDVETKVYAELETNPNAWELGAPVLGALKDTRAVPQLTTILGKGNWHAQVTAANAVTEIAGANKVNDKPLSEALIKAGQSEVTQVQEASDRALRALTKAAE